MLNETFSVIFELLPTVIRVNKRQNAFFCSASSQFSLLAKPNQNNLKMKNSKDYLAQQDFEILSQPPNLQSHEQRIFYIHFSQKNIESQVRFYVL